MGNCSIALIMAIARPSTEDSRPDVNTRPTIYGRIPRCGFGWIYPSIHIKESPIIVIIVESSIVDLEGCQRKKIHLYVKIPPSHPRPPSKKINKLIFFFLQWFGDQMRLHIKKIVPPLIQYEEQLERMKNIQLSLAQISNGIYPRKILRFSRKPGGRESIRSIVTQLLERRRIQDTQETGINCRDK